MTSERDARPEGAARVANDWPRVSVIMAVRNEAAFLEQSLGAVLGQDYPADRLEVLVADGLSTDGSREIVRARQADHPQLRLLDNPARTVAPALNAAIRAATGTIIVRVDGHTVIARDYARQCVEALRRSGAETVGGRMTAVGSGPFGEAVALATSSPFGVGNARFHYSDEEALVDTVYLGAWRREVFDRVGLFDENLVRNQDDEFNYRLASHGGSILLAPAIQSRYTTRSTPPALARQYFQYGYWKVRVLQKHPRQMRPRQFAPPSLVAALLSGAVLAPGARVARGAWLALLLLYGAILLAASLLTARGAGWQHLPRLPGVFATLHLSYGAGFLVGLVRFACFWRRLGGDAG